MTLTLEIASETVRDMCASQMLFQAIIPILFVIYGGKFCRGFGIVKVCEHYQLCCVLFLLSQFCVCVCAP